MASCQVRSAILLAVINHAHDVGVGQPGQGFGLALKTFENVVQLIRGERPAPDNLNGRIPFQSHVVSLIYRCHPAFTQLFEDVVATQGLTDQIRHISSKEHSQGF
jgi:hypothetical protein